MAVTRRHHRLRVAGPGHDLGRHLDPGLIPQTVTPVRVSCRRFGVSRELASVIGGLELGPRFSEHVAQDLLHLVELGLATDQWGSDLDDGVAAIVGAAVEAVLEQSP